jgi:hypothetical protein
VVCVRNGVEVLSSMGFSKWIARLRKSMAGGRAVTKLFSSYGDHDLMVIVCCV